MTDEAKARKFVGEWLWQEKFTGRQTGGLPWGSQYIHDAAKMCADYAALRATNPAQLLTADEALNAYISSVGYNSMVVVDGLLAVAELQLTKIGKPAVDGAGLTSEELKVAEQSKSRADNEGYLARAVLRLSSQRPTK